MNILMSYPATVDDTPNSASCTVQAGKVTTSPEKCEKIENARLFRIKEAIPVNYSGEVKISIEFKNPADNWGRVGVKIKTYEQGPKAEFLSDILEGN